VTEFLVRKALTFVRVDLTPSGVRALPASAFLPAGSLESAWQPPGRGSLGGDQPSRRPRNLVQAARGAAASVARADAQRFALKAWETMSTSSLATFVLPCAPCSAASRLCSGALEPA
jgi:hypothetical protein